MQGLHTLYFVCSFVHYWVSLRYLEFAWADLDESFDKTSSSVTFGESAITPQVTLMGFLGLICRYLSTIRYQQYPRWISSAVLSFYAIFIRSVHCTAYRNVMVVKRSSDAITVAKWWSSLTVHLLAMSPLSITLMQFQRVTSVFCKKFLSNQTDHEKFHLRCNNIHWTYSIL